MQESDCKNLDSHKIRRSRASCERALPFAAPSMEPGGSSMGRGPVSSQPPQWTFPAATHYNNSAACQKARNKWQKSPAKVIGSLPRLWFVLPKENPAGSCASPVLERCLTTLPMPGSCEHLGSLAMRGWGPWHGHRNYIKKSNWKEWWSLTQ